MVLLGRLGLETARIPHVDRHGLVWLERGRLYVEDGTLRFEAAGFGDPRRRRLRDPVPDALGDPDRPGQQRDPRRAAAPGPPRHRPGRGRRGRHAALHGPAVRAGREPARPPPGAALGRSRDAHRHRPADVRLALRRGAAARGPGRIARHGGRPHQEVVPAPRRALPGALAGPPLRPRPTRTRPICRTRRSTTRSPASRRRRRSRLRPPRRSRSWASSTRTAARPSSSTSPIWCGPA